MAPNVVFIMHKYKRDAASVADALQDGQAITVATALHCLAVVCEKEANQLMAGIRVISCLSLQQMDIVFTHKPVSAMRDGQAHCVTKVIHATFVVYLRICCKSTYYSDASNIEESLSIEPALWSVQLAFC